MEKFLNNCAEPPITKTLNIDPPNQNCDLCDKHPSQLDVPFIADPRKDKIGLGHQANCDEAQSGKIIDDFTEDPRDNYWLSSYIPRYSAAKRGCDEAVMDLFREIVVIDEQSTAHAVPIVWGSQERACAAILQANVRKDDSLVVDKIRLPLMAIIDTNFSIDNSRYIYHQAVDYLRGANGKPGFTASEKYERDTVFGVTRGLPVNIDYTLYVWTLFKEDLNQILEQIVLKFSPVCYIKIQGVYYESIVKLESIANNENVEPGGSNLRVIKWQFNLKAETFIPQPIIRKKAILKTKVQFTDDLDEEKITEIIGQLEESVKELRQS